MSSMQQSQQTGDLLIELLEVFTHNILCLRGVYPYGIFQKRRMYNCVVQRSRFPPLNEYIANALHAARFLLRAGQLHKFEVVLGTADTDGGPKYESYFFVLSPIVRANTATSNTASGSGGSSMDYSPPSSSSSLNNGGETAANRQPPQARRMTTRADSAHADFERLTDFEEQMRATLLTLDAKCKQLNALPADRLQFRVQLHTTQLGQAKLTDDVELQEFPWIGQENDRTIADSATILPFAEVCGVQMYAASYLPPEAF